MKPSVGVIGLRVMGSNLARNIESRGFAVAVHNRDQKVLADFMADVEGKNFVGCPTIEDLVSEMAAPRKIILMIEAGPPVDMVLEKLLPLVERGDVIVDGGNSFFTDTRRREITCQQAGVHFVGLGVSGGEEGALKGPSLMPGGSREAYDLLSPILEKIAAVVDGPCTTYVGPDGAGHFVKMVHNGIEYGDMQLIAEAYDLLRTIEKKSAPEMAGIFAKWNEGPLQSFLIEITATCLSKKDELGDGYLVDKILDKAGQKGTGRWTVTEAVKLGVAIPTLAAAVDARVLSSMKDRRVEAAKILAPSILEKTTAENLVEQIHDALYAAKIIAYAQGFQLLQTASDDYNWSLQLAELARIWKGGCIIRARFLEQITQAYRDEPELANLMVSSQFKGELKRSVSALRQIVCYGSALGIPLPAFAASLSYFDLYRTEKLPLNLTQAQRDLFGAHTYQRIDDPSKSHHTEWEN